MKAHTTTPFFFFSIEMRNFIVFAPAGLEPRSSRAARITSVSYRNPVLIFFPGEGAAVLEIEATA
jgi:hypothetical protein